MSNHLYYYIGEFGWSTRTSHRTNSGLYSTMSYVCTLRCPCVQDILYKPKSTSFCWHTTTQRAQEHTTTIPDPSYPVIYLSLSVLLPPLQVSQVKYFKFLQIRLHGFLRLTRSPLNPIIGFCDYPGTQNKLSQNQICHRIR